MGQIPQQLGGALRAGAAQSRAVLVPHHRRTAHRARLRQQIGLRPGGTLVHDHLQHLRDDLPRLAHQHRVPDADVLLGDEILIVQCGERDGGTRQPHRFQLRLGRQHAGAPHLNDDILYHRGLHLRRVFVRDGPLGELGRAADLLPLAQVVQLHHSAVDVKGELLPPVAQRRDLRQNVRRLGQPLVGNDLEMLAGQIVDGLRVGAECPPLRQLQIEHRDIQPPLGGDLGIQLPQGAGGGVAGIGHQRLALDLPPGVDLLEHAARHVDLAPDNEPGQLFRQCHGNGADGAEILRHVLPHPSVATGGAPDEHAVPVFQRHRQAVHLGLHAVSRVLQRYLFQKAADLIVVEHVLQTLQRYGVGHLLELRQRLSAHPLGGGIRCDLLRVLRLQLLQPPQQVVVFVVRHGGRIQHIIAVSVLRQRAAQLLYLLAIVHSQALIRCS